MPVNLELFDTAPLLCKVIITFSPLQHWSVTRGMRVGAVGLGHLGVKFVHIMGALTVRITTTPEKENDAISLRADEVLLSTNADAMVKEVGEFDFILNTIPIDHKVDPNLDLLKVDGIMFVLGAVEPLSQLNAAQLMFGRKNLAGSLIGGIQQTKEMLNFYGKHNITSDVEVLRMDQIQEAFERLVKSDVKNLFVIDMESLSAA